MIVFYVLLLVPILLQHIAVPRIGYHRKNKMALGLFFAGLFILLALRHRVVGNDTVNYIRIFDRITAVPLDRVEDFTSEFGFVLWCRLIGLLTENHQIFLALSAAVYVWLIAGTYMRLNTDTALTITLFAAMSVFVMLFSGIRQVLAMGIGMAAYEAVRQGKRLRFVLLVLLAASFHNSALVLLVLYPVYYANITRKWLYVVAPVMVLIFVFNGPIFNILLMILSRFSRFDMDAVSTGAYTMLVLLVLLAVFAYVVPDEQRMDPETKGLRNLLLLAVVVQMFAPLHHLAMRVNYYFLVFVPPLLPQIIRCRSQRMQQVALLGRHVLVAAMLVYFFGILAPSGALQVFPYHFVWERAVW